MDPDEEKYPMCERWARARPDFSIIQAFLDALQAKGVVLCKDVSESITDREIEGLYMDYCDVDPKALEDERRALVKSAQQTASPKCPQCKKRPLAYPGAVYCGAACSAMAEAHEPPMEEI